MLLSIVMLCYLNIATSLSIVALQWMSIATSLPIVVPQWGITSNVMNHCDVIMSHGTYSSKHSGNIHKNVVRAWVISTRDQGYGDHLKTSH